jgi:hypothetical protein
MRRTVRDGGGAALGGAAPLVKIAPTGAGLADGMTQTGSPKMSHDAATCPKSGVDSGFENSDV